MAHRLFDFGLLRHLLHGQHPVEQEIQQPGKHHQHHGQFDQPESARIPTQSVCR